MKKLTVLFVLVSGTAACERAENTIPNLTRIFGDYLSALAFKEQIERAYNSAFGSPQFALRWDPSGWAAMPAIPKVNS